MARKATARRNPAKSKRRARGLSSRSGEGRQPLSPPIGRTGKPLSEAYWKRLKAYAAKHGTTIERARQAARGHKAREHVPRRERELREGQTTYQRGKIKRIALKQAKRSLKPGMDEKAHAARMLAKGQDLFRRRGWAGIEAWRAFVARKARGRRYRPERLRGRKGGGKVIDLARAIEGRAANIEEMEDFADEYEIDFEMLFYH